MKGQTNKAVEVFGRQKPCWSKITYKPTLLARLKAFFAGEKNERRV